MLDAIKRTIYLDEGKVLAKPFFGNYEFRW